MGVQRQLELDFPPVKANPSKDIFIRMLTKDLSLADAILDLADNSVDGARRSRGKSTTYETFFLHIEFSKEFFRITDNCGGIDLDIAEQYAFRFGKPDDRVPERGLIGEFGVGMKRAIFKMGTKFCVESTTTNSRFVVEEDVAKWRDDKESWNFHFKEYQPGLARVPRGDIGTKIKVTSLHEEIASEFGSTSFRTELERRLQQAHQDAIAHGLEIKVLDHTLPAEDLTLKASPKIRPGFFRTTLEGSRKAHAAPISVRLYAGIAESNPKAAGWYIYCNGRQILAAEQNDKTVWGQLGDINIPKMHNQFSRFRGYAFFDCEDQSLLPWTTTKQGVDVESYAYQKVRPEMIRMTRPVIDFLNRLDKESELEATPIAAAVAKTKDSALGEITDIGDFDAAKVLNAEAGPKLVRINYQKPAEVVERVKNKLGVARNPEVGEATFDYFCEYEEIDVD